MVSRYSLGTLWCFLEALWCFKRRVWPCFAVLWPRPLGALGFHRPSLVSWLWVKKKTPPQRGPRSVAVGFFFVLLPNRVFLGTRSF